MGSQCLEAAESLAEESAGIPRLPGDLRLRSGRHFAPGTLLGVGKLLTVNFDGKQALCMQYIDNGLTSYLSQQINEYIHVYIYIHIQISISLFLSMSMSMSVSMSMSMSISISVSMCVSIPISMYVDTHIQIHKHICLNKRIYIYACVI